MHACTKHHKMTDVITDRETGSWSLVPSFQQMLHSIEHWAVLTRFSSNLCTSVEIEAGLPWWKSVTLTTRLDLMYMLEYCYRCSRVWLVSWLYLALWLVWLKVTWCWNNNNGDFQWCVQDFHMEALSLSSKREGVVWKEDRVPGAKFFSSLWCPDGEFYFGQWENWLAIGEVWSACAWLSVGHWWLVL